MLEEEASRAYVSPQQSSVYGCVWKVLLSLQNDPMDYVAEAAQVAVPFCLSSPFLQDLCMHV